MFLILLDPKFPGAPRLGQGVPQVGWGVTRVGQGVPRVDRGSFGWAEVPRVGQVGVRESPSRGHPETCDGKAYLTIAGVQL